VIGCSLVLYASRGVRRLGRGVATRIGRHARWPFAIRTVLGGTAVVALTGLLVMLGFAGSTLVFDYANNSTKGQTQPTSTLRSGSPASLISWDSLGNQGRAFVSEGPTLSAISNVTLDSAVEPIRIYAGLESADGLQAQADLAVADLARARQMDLLIPLQLLPLST
jgi:uncharacterized membrane protein